MRAGKIRSVARAAAGRCHLWQVFGVLGALVALAGANASAAPIEPPIPNHAWLLDELGAGPYGRATPDMFGGLPLYGVKLHGGSITSISSSTRTPELAGPGDKISVTPADPNHNGAWNQFTQLELDSSAVKFAYNGNKSAVNDWGTTRAPATSSYPERVNLTPYVSDAQNLPGGGLHIKGSTSGGGAISFWINPIRHEPNGYGYFFDMADAAGNRLAATADAYESDEWWGAYVKTEVNGSSTGYVLYRDPTHYPWDTDPSADPYGWGPGVNFGGNDTPDSQPGGRWSNIVITWGPDGSGGTILQAYSNGSLLAEVLGMEIPDFYATAINIGGRIGGGYAFPALLDEVGIWDTQLTAEHVEWLYQNSLSTLGVPVPEPASASLLLAGLIGLAAWRRRSGRREA